MSTALQAAGLAVLEPVWPVAPWVRGAVTGRLGGVSAGAYGDHQGRSLGLNLADHVGDAPDCVQHNRARVQALLPASIQWLQQVHGTAVHGADAPVPGEAPPCADAAVTTSDAVVLAVLTADCLPIFLADEAGRGVALVHAGWRGLRAGITEAAVQALRSRLPGLVRMHAWLGPAIGPAAFEVGESVRTEFCARDPQAARAFVPAERAGYWYADLYQLARQKLTAAGVASIHGGGHCTLTDAAHFYSYRRDGCTGRMSSLLWLDRRTRV